MTIWGDIPSVPLTGVASPGILQGGRYFQVAIFIELFQILSLLTKLASRKSIQHPDHPMIKLRAQVEDKDLPDAQNFDIPPDFGK